MHLTFGGDGAIRSRNYRQNCCCFGPSSSKGDNILTAKFVRCRTSCLTSSITGYHIAPIITGTSKPLAARANLSASVSRGVSWQNAEGSLSLSAPQSRMVEDRQTKPIAASFSWSSSCQYLDQSSMQGYLRHLLPGRHHLCHRHPYCRHHHHSCLMATCLLIVHHRHHRCCCYWLRPHYE